MTELFGELLSDDEPGKLNENHQELKLSKTRLHFMSHSRISPHVGQRVSEIIQWEKVGNSTGFYRALSC